MIFITVNKRKIDFEKIFSKLCYVKITFLSVIFGYQTIG